ncbi:2OG-Fe(II) oxygenase [Streptomyces sp. NPDC015345]|uniref:2OG-Fe(II) oxygenase n=1 Tax=Streptomyces sp. NPDC015345 TaxID=3364953 RepID=UPI0036FF574D
MIADQGTKKISPFDEMENPRVIEAERITRDDLLSLAHGEAIAIVVRDYCPQDLCARATQQLLHDSLYGEYANVPGVHKWGLNTYEGLSSKEREQHYFSEAVAAVQSLRDAWAPYLSPIDRLRLELQEGWPGGANMEHLEGNPLFVGQARVFTEGKGAIPHQDFLSWELEDLRREDRSDGKAELLTQMTANLYLQTADEGGELELWSRGYEHAEYDVLRASADSYGLNRDLIPEPAVALKPTAGMLILSHASRIHAVRPSKGRDRAAVSFFIGVRGTEQPLTYWS